MSEDLLSIGRPAARTHFLEQLIAQGQTLDVPSHPVEHLAVVLAGASDAEALTWLPAPDLGQLTLEPEIVADLLRSSGSALDAPYNAAVLWDDGTNDRLWLALATRTPAEDVVEIALAWQDGVGGECFSAPLIARHIPRQEQVMLERMVGDHPNTPDLDREGVGEAYLSLLVRPLLYARIFFAGLLKTGDGDFRYEPDAGPAGTA